MTDKEKALAIVANLKQTLLKMEHQKPIIESQLKTFKTTRANKKELNKIKDNLIKKYNL
jgi:transposase